MAQMNLFMKQRQIHRHRKQMYVQQKEKGWGRDKLGSLGLANTNYCILNR